MPYHELSVPGPDKRHVRIGVGDNDYELDLVGHDDGNATDPNASFRLIFQLGQGYGVYLYVVGMARPNDPRAFHTFWFKGYVTVEMDMEEHGPPSHVECDLRGLPAVWERLHLTRGEEVQTYGVARFDFRSRPVEDRGAPDLRAVWQLRDAAGGPATLTYSSGHGWNLSHGEASRALRADERITFSIASRRSELRHAIDRAPSDPLPRLAYADWLDRIGEPELAEFFRLDAELVRPGLAAGAVRPFANRKWTLFSEHAQAWAEHLPLWVTWIPAAWKGDPRLAIQVRSMEDYLDHVRELTSITAFRVQLADESSVTASPDGRFLLAHRTERTEAYGSNPDDYYDHYFTVWDVATRKVALARHEQGGTSQGEYQGVSSARFGADSSTLEILTPRGVTETIPLQRTHE